MRVALGHFDGLVAHEALDCVQRGALDGQPGGKGMAQGMKDDLVFGVRGGEVEAQGFHGLVEDAGHFRVSGAQRVHEDVS